MHAACVGHACVHVCGVCAHACACMPLLWAVSSAGGSVTPCSCVADACSVPGALPEVFMLDAQGNEVGGPLRTLMQPCTRENQISDGCFIYEPRALCLRLSYSPHAIDCLQIDRMYIEHLGFAGFVGLDLGYS
eukprot:144719-Chlamydomonas_euryale.AAC.2